MSTTLDAGCSRCGRVQKVRVRLRRVRAAAAGFCRGSRRRPERRRRLVHRQHDLADLDLLALLDLDFLDDARNARRNFDRRLVGLELENGLILLQLIARLHHDANHVACDDVLAKFGNYEVSHGVRPRRGLKPSRSAAAYCLLPTACPAYVDCYAVAGFAFSALIPRSAIAFCTTFASSLPSRMSADSVATTMKRASTSK